MILAPISIRLEAELQGFALPRLFEEVTGIGHMNFRRRGFAPLLDSDRDIRAAQKAWLVRNLKGWNLPSGEADAFLEQAPEGVAARMAFALGMLSPTSCVGPLIEALDRSDARLFDAYEQGDEARLQHELGPESELGEAYCAPLDVAGFDATAMRGPLTTDNVVARIHIRRAHMLMALLAGLDHEWVRLREERLGSGDWTGRSQFAALLLPASPGPARVREKHEDPFARLVDLIGAVGHVVHHGKWPTSPPSIKDIAGRVDVSTARAEATDSERYVRTLRSGESPMTLANFRLFARTQCWKGEKDEETPLDVAMVLLPHLLAAHVFSLLMPERAEKPRHRDRRGWREAYLGWWRRVGDALGQPTSPESERVPKWLFEP